MEYRHDRRPAEQDPMKAGPKQQKAEEVLYASPKVHCRLPREVRIGPRRPEE